MKAKRQEVIWGIGSFICLDLLYLLCRYILFDLHGMKQWPDLLAAAGIIVLAAALIKHCKALILCTNAGYIAGFLAGICFRSYGTDAGGGRTSNTWMIWILVYAGFMVLGLLIDLVRKRHQ